MNQTTCVDDRINTQYLTTCQDDFESFDIDQSDESIFTSSEGSDKSEPSNNSLNISSTESEESINKENEKPNEPIETTYVLYGKIIRPTIFKEQIWWIVDIYDPNEVKKLNRPCTIGISAMFLYEPVSDQTNYKNYRYFKPDQIVKVNITYNDRGHCLYMKNIIDMSEKLHLD